MLSSLIFRGFRALALLTVSDYSSDDSSSSLYSSDSLSLFENSDSPSDSSDS